MIPLNAAQIDVADQTIVRQGMDVEEDMIRAFFLQAIFVTLLDSLLLI